MTSDERPGCGQRRDVHSQDVARLDPFVRPNPGIFLLLLTVQVAALALCLAVALTGPVAPVWGAVAAMALLWVFSGAARLVLRRNLSRLYRLTVEGGEGDGREDLPGVTVISPARDEEETVEPAARSLAALDYPSLEVILVNDHSSDSTGAVLDRVAAESPPVRVLHDPPREEDWLGKANAVWRAVETANPAHRWLVLTDADVEFHPKVLRRAVAHAETCGADFVTCVPCLESGSPAEELILPGNWASVVVSADPDRLNNPKGQAIGMGAFILVKRRVYLESGGHCAIRDQQPEDTLLAALVKQSGGVVDVVWTSDMLRVRLYRGYRQIRDTLVRKQRIHCDDRLLRLAPIMLNLLLLDVLPLPLALAAVVHQIADGTLHLGLTCVALLGVAAFVERTRFLRHARAIAPTRSCIPWLHPIGGLLRLWLYSLSAAGIVAGAPMAWRGRVFRNVRSIGTSPSSEQPRR